MADILPLLGEGGPSEHGWHQIEGFIKCPKRFQFEKIRGIRKPNVKVPDYFAVGSLFHAGRATWFANGFDTSDEVWLKIKDAVQKAVEKYELPVAPEAERVALRYLQEYVDYYSVRPQPKVIAAEYPLGPTRITPDYDVVRTARLDDVSFYPEAGGKLCIGESKTTGADFGTVINQYQMHGQPMLQALLWKLALQGEAQHGAVAGVMLDMVQKGYGGKRCKFSRVFLEVIPFSLEWFSSELAFQIMCAGSVSWDDNPIRRITSCSEMQGTQRVACPFRELCQHGKDAALDYILADGKRLTDYEPVPGAKCMPWE